MIDLNCGVGNPNYGMYFHENSAVLGTPRFLDVRRYL